MNSFLTMIGNFARTLFDDDATFKQLVARWIIALMTLAFFTMMGSLVVQMCMIAPGTTAAMGGFFLGVVIFFWALFNI